jgi:hypothetical protein
MGKGRNDLAVTFLLPLQPYPGHSYHALKNSAVG